MASLTLKNPGGTDVVIGDVGYTIPAGGQDTYLDPESITALAMSYDCRDYVADGTLVVYDGGDLTPSQGLLNLENHFARAGFDTDPTTKGITRFASSETELISAITDLNAAGGGNIIINGSVTLTSDQTWDLNDIILQGGDVQTGINLNSYKITFSGDVFVQGVPFYGTLTTPVASDCQTIFRAAEGPAGRVNRRWVFQECYFSNCVGGIKTTPVVDLSGLNGGTYQKQLLLRFLSCRTRTTNESDTNTLAGFVVDAGTMGGATDLVGVYLTVQGSGGGFYAGEARWGLRRDVTSTGIARIYADDCNRIVETTNLSEPPIGMSLCPPVEVVTSGTRTLNRQSFGTMISMANTGASASIVLPAAGQITADDRGGRVEWARVGTQDVVLSVPSGVTVYYGNVTYTNTLITFKSVYLKSILTIIAADTWILETSVAPYTVVVVNEQQFLAADNFLSQIGGGIIQLGNTITLTADRTVNLDNIRVMGISSVGSPGPKIQFGVAGSNNTAFALTITGDDVAFSDVQFLGTKSAPNGGGTVGSDCNTLLKFSNPNADPSRSISFQGCTFKNGVGTTKVNPVIDFSACDGQGDMDVGLTLSGTNIFTDGATDASSLGGLVVNAGAGGGPGSSNVSGMEIYVPGTIACLDGGQNRVGARVTGAGTGNYCLMTDAMSGIVEATNFSAESLEGNEVVRTVPSSRSLEFVDFGALLRCTNGSNITLTLSANIGSGNIGQWVDILRGAAGDVVIAVPNGYTAYYRGTLYTGPTTITLNEARQMAHLQVATATEWIIEDSGQGGSGSQGYQGNQGFQGTGSSGAQGYQGYQGPEVAVAPVAVVQARRTTTCDFTSSWADVTLDTTDVETDAAVLEHDLVGNQAKIIAHQTGCYFLQVGSVVHCTADGAFSLRLRKNNSATLDGSEVIQDKLAGIDGNLFTSVFANLTAEDYITIQIEDSGGSADGYLHVGTTFGVELLEGPSGAQGRTGAQGEQGIQGFQGTNPGPAGPQGNQGVQGLQGTGVQGFQGNQGNQGQGVQGSQGPQGFQGNQGVSGPTAVGFRYDADTTSQTDTDPGAGKLKWNHITQASATQLYVDDLDKSSSDLSAFYNTLQPGDRVRLQKEDDKALFQDWTITSVTDRTGWFRFNVTLDFSAGSFSNNDPMVLIFYKRGYQGNQGPQGPIGYQGAQGIQGNQGNQGRQGNQGAQGYQGTGVQGPQGNQGNQGNQGRQGSQGSDISQKYVFFADQLDTPVTSNWAVNARAPATADPSNTALVIRRFDDTAEEGVGFSVITPLGVTNITLEFYARAITAPGTAKQVILRLYVREIPDNAAVEAWSAATELTAIDIPTNAYFQYDSQTIAFATLGLVAGRVAQFELTRYGGAAADTLVGDWAMLAVRVSFS